jgi:hypothetical protein
MAYTQQNLDDLRAAIREGVLRIRSIDGQEVTYRSLAEMRQIEAAMVADIGTAQPRIKRTVYSYSRDQ